MRPRRKLYGWQTLSGQWCLGRNPPDVPIPHSVYGSCEEAEAAASTRRYQVIWCGAAAETRRVQMAMAVRQ
jgi:hypothetical protein